MVRSDYRNTERGSNMRRFGGLGITFVSLIAVFTAGGYGLGRLAGGMAVFVLLGMFVGFAAALCYLYLKLKELGDG
jgi:O-antigen/teichoic acid export membrane protein